MMVSVEAIENDILCAFLIHTNVGSCIVQLAVLHRYEYLVDCQQEMARPAAWMPRPSEFESRDRQDLKFAIARFGGGESLFTLPGWYPIENSIALRGSCSCLQS